MRSTPALTWLSITLALPAALFEVWSLVDDSPTIIALAHTALAVFYFYTAYALIAYMFEDSWVTKDELFAVGACFTVLVFAFAYLFMAVQEIYPGSFTAFDGRGTAHPPRADLPTRRANLTSVGLSDVGPIRPEARAVVHRRAAGRRHVRRDGHLPARRAHRHARAAVTPGQATGAPSRSSMRARLGPRVSAISREHRSASPSTRSTLPLVRAARSASLHPRSASAASRRG